LRCFEGLILFYSIRARLIISFIGVSILVGVISLFIGSQLLYRAVLNEATMRISLDLNAAREIYMARIENIDTTLTISSLNTDFRKSIENEDCVGVSAWLTLISQRSGLDFAGIVLANGATMCGNTAGSGKIANVSNPIAEKVFKTGKEVSGTVLLEHDFLMAQNPELADRALIKIRPTPHAAPRYETEESTGMALCAGIPIYRNNEIYAVLYGGSLLNRSKKIVDTVRGTVFQNEIYDGRSIGTATIFLKDLRISTNVLTAEGERAVGTRVSKEVRDRVLIEGERWTDRAFVVSDWYITAYEPIEDINDERVGILYVGVLEKKYRDIRHNLLRIFILITLSGVVVAIGLGYIVTTRLVYPIRRLIRASSAVAEGNLEPEIGHIAKNEIGILQKNFSDMLSSLQERDRRQRAESEDMLFQSEKQAGIGRLAAGVAHEINNPLTGVLTFTHMLLRRNDINDEIRSDLQTIAHETERVRKIVKGLLDFSRQTRLEQEPTDINNLVKTTIGLVENQAIVNGISLVFKPADDLPVRTLDRNQIQSVILNIIINAFDAAPSGGIVTVSTALSVSSTGKTKGRKGVEISIADTGCGIPPENLDKLFDPFFTTKEVGQGTGLGLSVSYGIIERHGGVIQVHSEVGRGSVFTIWLPLEEK
jgi:two-component system NtrC family sensor kinase